MNKELQRMNDADWKVYNSKDIMQDVLIIKDQFRNKTKKQKWSMVWTFQSTGNLKMISH